MDSITIIGLLLIFFFCLTRILKFYGLDESVYGVYILFYILLCLCVFVLPNKDPEF
jgi:hypothetical protein